MEKKVSKMKVAFWIIGFVVLLILFFAFLFIWSQPLLGKKLPMVTETTVANSSVTSSSETAVPTKAANSDTVNEPESNITDTSDLLVLALGIDNNAQADAITFIRINLDEHKVTILSIPRDLYVPIVGFEQHGIVEGRINAIYGYGEYYEGNGKGIEAFANNVANYFGLQFDHYLVVHMNNVERLIDRIGGIDIYLDKPVDGRTQGMEYYAAGYHHLDGKHTVDFLRIRFPDDDHQRILRRNMIIKSIMKKLMSTKNIPGLVAFAVDALREKGIQTDFSAKDAYSLVLFAKTLSSENVSFVSLPSDLYRSTVTNGGAAVIMPREGLVDFVREVMTR